MITTSGPRVLAEYQNGNCQVTLFTDGSKIRQFSRSEGPRPRFPESIDVKITNYCDMGCPYCHESSTKVGRHGDLFTLLEVLRPLPPGTELAIGGGNPLSHPYLEGFLETLRRRGIIANITINQGHIDEHGEKVRKFLKSSIIFGVGISVTDENSQVLRDFASQTPNTVYHVIAGVNDIRGVQNLLLDGSKVLVLGYKTFGRGVKYHENGNGVPESVQNWRQKLPTLVSKTRSVLSFDNLAIEQLNVRRMFTDEGWETFYMGDDGRFSMYIDSVERTYAKTSRSLERVSFQKATLRNFFHSLYPPSKTR